MRWLSKTLTRKFILLLAGFLALQACMLVIGVVGVWHLGEEGAFINEAARQRYRTLLVIVRAEEALADGGDASRVSSLLKEIDATFKHFKDFLDNDLKYEGLLFHGAHHTELRAAVIQADAIWLRDLRPLADMIDRRHPAAAHAALKQYKAAAPVQVERLEAIVTMLEGDVRKNTIGLVWFSVVVLGSSFLLGLAGFAMANYIVSRPLRRLIDGANAIASGAYDRRVIVSSRDEIGELAQTFNRMAAAISEKTSRIAALNHIAVKITSAQTLRALLDEIMIRGMGLSGSQAACIVFYSEESHRFKEHLTEGLSDDYVSHVRRTTGGVAQDAFMSGTVIVSSNRPEATHRLGESEQNEKIQCYICIPLTSHASRLGAVNFYRKDRDYFLQDEIEILKTFAHLVAGAIENARLYEQTQNLAITDKLTGLRNRRMFDERLLEEIVYATELAKPLSLLMIDIDNFKRVNDTHGHLVGDKVLQTVGHELSGQLWKVDLAARYGGEEFAVILSQTDATAATKVAERIRRSIAQAAIMLPDGNKISVTVSVGIACFPRCGKNAESLVNHADQALYAAKSEGKNRVCLYREILKKKLGQNPAHIIEMLNQDIGNIEPIVTALSAKAVHYHDRAAIVERVTRQMVRALDLSGQDRDTLHFAAQLHDVGMFTVPDAILNKKDALTGADWELIRRHPGVMADFLEKVPALGMVAPIVRHHHERYDGKGYPDGLKDENIPYLARVLAVVDTYVSMMGEWAGHKALPHVEARARLMAAGGAQLDPEIVSQFVRILDSEQAPAADTGTG